MTLYITSWAIVSLGTKSHERRSYSIVVLLPLNATSKIRISEVYRFTAVRIALSSKIGVGEGVNVLVGVGVTDGVNVAVGVFEGVNVAVGVGVFDGVNVAVGVGVLEGVKVGVNVFVGV